MKRGAFGEWDKQCVMAEFNGMLKKGRAGVN
jgi:hypothetical protein